VCTQVGCLDAKLQSLLNLLNGHSVALGKAICFPELEKGLLIIHLGSCLEYFWHVTPMSAFPLLADFNSLG
jgi:hypothetical protein